MDSEILDEDIDDNIPIELGYKDIIFCIFLGLTGFSLLSIAYADYNHIVEHILTLYYPPKGGQVTFKFFSGILFLLAAIGLATKIKRTHLILISITSLITTFYALELYTITIFFLIQHIITYSIIASVLIIYTWKRRSIILFDQLFYTSITLGIILGSIAHFFGERIIIEIMSFF